MTSTPLGRPINTTMNNGIVCAIHATPMKEMNSDGDASFATGRNVFSRTYTPASSNTIKIGNMVIQRQALGLSNNQIIETGPKTPLQKRWIGGNHDSSNVTNNRRNRAIGQTVNPTKTPQSNGNINDINLQRRVIQRSRNQGSVVPLKKTQKYLSTPAFIGSTH